MSMKASPDGHPGRAISRTAGIAGPSQGTNVIGDAVDRHPPLASEIDFYVDVS
jgi:hypothetical protein